MRSNVRARMTNDVLEALIAAGCPRCRSTRLAFRAYVEGKVPLLAGEPVGRIAWAYKGEDFCEGVFEVTCVACKAVVFEDDACPSCRRPGALESVLETENAFDVPRACPRCATDEVRYAARVPATVVHDAGRAQGTPARTTTELCDPGFHGVRAECKACGMFAAVTACCALCGT